MFIVISVLIRKSLRKLSISIGDMQMTCGSHGPVTVETGVFRTNMMEKRAFFCSCWSGQHGKTSLIF